MPDVLVSAAVQTVVHGAGEVLADDPQAVWLERVRRDVPRSGRPNLGRGYLLAS
jgi:hypothetical protein